MPVYEYQCQGCGNELEVTQRITDEPLQICPSCGGAMQRLISNTSFILKGTGWYATDYARKKSPEKTSDQTTESKSTSGEKKDTSNVKKDTDT